MRKGWNEGVSEWVRERENEGGRERVLLWILITCINAEYQYDTESHDQHNLIF